MDVDPNAPASAMTVRLAIAAHIMGHLCAMEPRSDFSLNQDALCSLDAADALIAAHNEEPTR